MSSIVIHNLEEIRSAIWEISLALLEYKNIVAEDYTTSKLVLEEIEASAKRANQYCVDIQSELVRLRRMQQEHVPVENEIFYCEQEIAKCRRYLKLLSASRSEIGTIMNRIKMKDGTLTEIIKTQRTLQSKIFMILDNLEKTL